MGSITKLATMTFDLAFDLQGQIQGRRRGTGYNPEATLASEPKMFQTKCSLPEQLTQPHNLTLNLTMKIKCQTKGIGSVSWSGWQTII